MMAKMSTDVDETIKEAFYIFDSDGSGAISSEEFRKVMMTLGAQMTDEEVTEIIEEVDVDGDGQINLEGNFISCLLIPGKGEHLFIIIIIIYYSILCYSFLFNKKNMPSSE